MSAIKNCQLFFSKQALFLYCKYGTRLNGLAASFDDDPPLVSVAAPGNPAGS